MCHQTEQIYNSVDIGIYFVCTCKIQSRLLLTLKHSHRQTKLRLHETEDVYISYLYKAACKSVINSTVNVDVLHTQVEYQQAEVKNTKTWLYGIVNQILGSTKKTKSGWWENRLEDKILPQQVGKYNGMDMTAVKAYFQLLLFHGYLETFEFLSSWAKG